MPTSTSASSCGFSRTSGSEVRPRPGTTRRPGLASRPPRHRERQEVPLERRRLGTALLRQGLASREGATALPSAWLGVRCAAFGLRGGERLLVKQGDHGGVGQALPRRESIVPASGESRVRLPDSRTSTNHPDRSRDCSSMALLTGRAAEATGADSGSPKPAPCITRSAIARYGIQVLPDHRRRGLEEGPETVRSIVVAPSVAKNVAICA